MTFKQVSSLLPILLNGNQRIERKTLDWFFVCFHLELIQLDYSEGIGSFDSILITNTSLTMQLHEGRVSSFVSSPYQQFNRSSLLYIWWLAQQTLSSALLTNLLVSHFPSPVLWDTGKLAHRAAVRNNRVDLQYIYCTWLISMLAHTFLPKNLKRISMIER